MAKETNTKNKDEVIVEELTSFDQLAKNQCVFVDNKPVKKEVTWTQKQEDGTEKSFKFNVFVRRQSFGIFSNFLEAGTNSKQSCRLLVESLAKDEKGTQPLLTMAQAESLDPSLAILFLNAIGEVNTKKN